MQLHNKTALVTGASRGIGKAIALKFAEEGANVILVATNLETVKKTAEELQQKAKGRIAYYTADVSNTQEVDSLIEKIVAECGSVDILVNNAGITRDGLLMKMSENDFDDVIAVNLKSLYNTCHALVRSFLKNRKGKIINISSVVGLTGNAGQTNYAAAKAGVIGFTKSLAQEVASRGITVNAVAPGFIETDMTDALTDEQKSAILKTIPMQRLGKAEEIAEAVLFLSSKASDYITGQVLTVDGGMVM